MAQQNNLQEKEQFTEKMKDEQLIAQINDWEQESEDLYTHLKGTWKQNLDYYHGRQTFPENLLDRSVSSEPATVESEAVENRIWMAVETSIPIATSSLPDIVVRAEDEHEQSQMDADDLQDIINYHMERVGVQALGERFLREMFLKRYGVFKVFWDEKEDDVGLKVIDSRRIRVPKFGNTVDELAYVIEDLELSYEQAKDFFGKGKADELLQNRSPRNENDTDGKRKVRDKTFTVQEVWTNDLVVWRSDNILLKKDENPFFSFGNKKKNFFKQAKKPYIIKSLFETDESIIGDTDYVQQLIPVQDNINTRKRQVIDILNKVSNPNLLIDSSVMSEEQASQITNQPGQIIYGTDAADPGKVRFDAPGQVSNALFADLQESRQEFDNIWGLHSTTRGERQGKETLGGRLLLRQADLGRIDGVARQLERALDEIAEYWTQLIKMFYNGKRAFTILGDDGTRFINNFTGDKIGDNVKPMVKAGSTLPRDEVTQRQEAIQLWQLGAIGIRTFYKMLKLPNLAEALEDYKNFQSGAFLQGAGQQPTQLSPDQSTGQNIQAAVNQVQQAQQQIGQ